MLLLSSARAALAGYSPPYSANAPWNIPVSAVGPTNLHPSDATWRQRFADLNNSPFDNLNLREMSDAFTFPVYRASEATETWTVSCSFGNMDGRPIPWNPSWQIPGGTDQQFILLNEATGEEINGWQVSLNPTTQVLSATRCNRVNVEQSESTFGTAKSYITGDGIFLPARGVGIAYYAMLLTPEDIALPAIPHALTMVFSIACAGNTFVAPAVKTDGSATAGIPEGARCFWDITTSEIDATIAALPAGVSAGNIDYIRKVLVCLRDYGAFATDRGGPTTTFAQHEHVASSSAKWAALGVSDQTVSFQVYPRDAVDRLAVVLGGYLNLNARIKWLNLPNTYGA